MNFSGVPVEYLDLVWERVEPYLARACARGGEYSTIDLLKELIKRNMQMWVAFDGDTLKTGEIYAVCITEILSLPQKRACSILIGTGKRREEWQGFIDHIEKWALENGCQSMKVLARPGWERIHTTYRKTHSLLEKEL